MSTPLSTTARGIAEDWSREFSNVMQAMADLRPEIELRPASEKTRRADLLWWKQPFDLADGAVLWVGFAVEAWTHLGQKILTAAGIEAAAPDEVRSTFLEVLRQSLGSLANVLSTQAGREVRAQEGEEQPPAVEAAEEFRFGLRAGEDDLPEIELAIAEPVIAGLSRRLSSAQAETSLPPDGSLAPADDSRSTSRTFDVLLDVEMPVSVSFGRSQLRLQDVLKLITGSIIELDRAIAEPVEVIVNNCVIARGEVVVVDGNYGVRISEVMSRSDRLKESRRYLLPGITHRR
jgi:flagellar motor switch protein FliN/FliY